MENEIEMRIRVVISTRDWSFPEFSCSNTLRSIFRWNCGALKKEISLNLIRFECPMDTIMCPFTLTVTFTAHRENVTTKNHTYFTFFGCEMKFMTVLTRWSLRAKFIWFDFNLICLPTVYLSNTKVLSIFLCMEFSVVNFRVGENSIPGFEINSFYSFIIELFKKRERKNLLQKS